MKISFFSLLKHGRNIFASVGFLAFLIFFSIIFNNQLLLKKKLNPYITKIFKFFPNGTVSINSFEELYHFGKEGFLGVFSKSSFPELNVVVKKKNLIQLKRQLQLDQNYFVPASFVFNDKNSLEISKGKIRKKGDRELHYENFERMSFRVNLKNEFRFRGLEKFSIQQPIIRNYSWEYLIAKVMEIENLLSLDQGPLFLSVNGEYRGLFSYEEVPSKRTIESRNRKSGPIFSLNENLSSEFPNIFFEVYDKNEWENSTIYNYSISILSKLVDDNTFSNNGDLNNFFDINEWAKYFALSDLFGSYHGVVPKSVKFYYNPTIGKFQPIFFDGHKGAGFFKNFIILDFLKNDLNQIDCEWVCGENNWFLIFLKNKLFLKHYLDYLKKFSQDYYFEKIINIYNQSFKKIDREYYSRLMPADGVFYRGLGLYHFDKKQIYKRALLIRKKVEELQLTNISKINKDKFYQNILLNNLSTVNDEKIKIIHAKDLKINNSFLSYERPTILNLEGNTILKGIKKGKPLIIDSEVMIIQTGGSIKIENTYFGKLKNFKISSRNLSGGINIINASADINNLIIENFEGEDAVNIVNSSFNLDSINIHNTSHDALDIDFSNGNIANVTCSDIGNDCLDLSGTKILVRNINAVYIKDKIVSAGEKSFVKINFINGEKSSTGLVSKDGSYVSIQEFNVNSIDILAAVYMKKIEFEQPQMYINKINYVGSKDNFGRVFSNDRNFIVLKQQEQNIQIKDSNDILDIINRAHFEKNTNN